VLDRYRRYKEHGLLNERGGDKLRRLVEIICKAAKLGSKGG